MSEQPNWFEGYVPPADEWNSWWARKMDNTDPVVFGGPWMPLAGGSMQGPLVLVGDPLDALQAATKQYVDVLNTSAVQRYGDTMSGNLYLVSDPVDPLQAATKQYVDYRLPLAGGRMSGLLVLSGDPVEAFGAASKQYVDNYPYLLRAGGTMTGLLTLSGDPTTDLQAATRRYVNSIASQVYNPKGSWNAATNTPTLSNNGGGGIKGDIYTVTTAGTTSLDGVASWAVGDQVQNSGIAWFKVPFSTSFGTMAFQQANAVNITGGALAGLTSVGWSDSSVIQPGSAIMPDLAAWWRDTSGNIAMAFDTTGMLLVNRLQVIGSSSFVNPSFIGNTSVTGNFSASGTGNFGGALTALGLLFLNGDVEQVGSSMMPDLARWVRDAAGNIVFGFSTAGDTIVNNLQVQGTLTAPGFSGGGGGGSSKPADAIDITDPKYGGKGDGRDNVFLGTWTAGAATLTLSRYSGAVTWPTSGNTLTLTTIASNPGFDPSDVGQYVYISATDGSGITQTVQITAWISGTSVTVSANPATAVTTATVSWPAFVSTDVGKAIRVEGATFSLIRQAWNSGAMPYLGNIATVVAGNQVTVTGPHDANFSTTAVALPTRVSWGTDNSGAYYKAQADVLAGTKYIWHPRVIGQGQTVYCAFIMSQRMSFDNWFFNYSQDVTPVYLNAVWIGDPGVIGVLTDVSGKLLPKRLVPSRSPPPIQPNRDTIARLHFPRMQAATTVNVVSTGDSLSKYDPTGQSQAWFPMPVWESLMRVQNPKKTLLFQSISSVTGAGWSELVDPTGGLAWVVPGTDLYFLATCGNNDGYRGHAIKVMSGINLARGSGNDGSGRPPDVLLTSGAAKPDAPSPNGATVMFDGHLHTEMLLRSMAKCQGIGLLDLTSNSEQIMHGASHAHRELRKLPEALNWNLTPATPFQFAAECYSWSAQIALSAGASQLWTTMGSLRVRLSPMPGNELIIDADTTASRVRYEARLWGRSVATTVTTSGATITTTTGTTATGSIHWTANQNQLTFDAGGFTGQAGKCLYLPTGDISNQPQRTYIAQVVNDTTAIVDDFWWGAPPGGQSNTLISTMALTIGGQMFLPADAVAQVDVVMTWGTSVYRGKVTGYTNANTATLTPAPPTLTGQAVQMWIGRTSVGPTNTTISSTGTSTTLFLSFDRDILSIARLATTCEFRGPVERYGCRMYPRFSITGAGPITAQFTNLFADRDVYYQPAGTLADLWAGDAAYSGGGSGGHDPSLLSSRLTRRVYEAADFCAT